MFWLGFVLIWYFEESKSPWKRVCVIKNHFHLHLIMKIWYVSDIVHFQTNFFAFFHVFLSQVNVVCAKVNGEPVYEIHRPIAAHQELVVYYLAERPEELLFVHMRSTLYRRTMDSILEGKVSLAWHHRILKGEKIIIFQWVQIFWTLT